MNHITLLTICYGVISLICSISVTIHILLTKRDTASCAGWIGVCWLMPLFGSVLYLMFGINRVHRRAQKMMDEEGTEHYLPLKELRHEVKGQFLPLVKMLDRLTGHPLLGGNIVRCLHDGDNAYPVMLEAISQAQHSVLLCSYIFRHDIIGEKFVEVLSEAKNRGVEVRVLVDGIGSGYIYSDILRSLDEKNIKCARFMHSFLPWRMPFINLRNHRKILVIDGKIGFLGGLNIGAENLLRVTTHQPVADTHFRFEGPVITQLTEAFVKDWAFTTNEVLTGPRYFPQPVPIGNVPARIVTSGPDADMEKIEYAMLQAIILAKKEVWFMSPYFIPDNRFATELGLAALRGVEVNILVPKESNHKFTDYARNACLPRLIDVGCHIWLGGPPFNHSKLMVVDRNWSFVGSSNLDRRSLRLNFEINVEIHDFITASHLEGFIKRHCSEKLTKEDYQAWSLPVRLRNAVLRLFTPYL
ncbi:cardiolipin synthase [Aristophania vespae]|uniref:cardiolipin synthase n=1 Tax=Aristophania vespae TaxID=2697033 RepID=UPI00235107F1|nr:cardiolipin synthase [Aristophania vespae]UMM64730.1 Major cardiolipin synthase ClsA [Aristophania vespae]